MNKKTETKKFSQDIERLRRQKKLTYMEAIIHYCETYDYDLESAAKVLSPLIKSQLRIEAENLHFIQANKRRLPI